MREVSLLVCGEPMRGDDALAAAIVERLPATTRRLVTIPTSPRRCPTTFSTRRAR